MADLPFRSDAAQTSSPGSIGDVSHLPPGAENSPIDQPSVSAPGGRFPQDDLPMVAYHGGGSGFTEGFSPSPENPPLPTDPMDGVGLTPTGNRR